MIDCTSISWWVCSFIFCKKHIKDFSSLNDQSVQVSTDYHTSIGILRMILFIFHILSLHHALHLDLISYYFFIFLFISLSIVGFTSTLVSSFFPLCLIATSISCFLHLLHLCLVLPLISTSATCFPVVILVRCWIFFPPLCLCQWENPTLGLGDSTKFHGGVSV